MQTVNRLKSSKIARFLAALLAFLIFCIATVAWNGVSVAPERPLMSTTHTYITQPDATDGQDTFLAKAFSTTIFGAEHFIRVGENSLAAPDRETTGLIKFDLSQIPTYATLTNVQLTLTIANMESNDNHLQVSVRYLKRDWAESTATWNIFSTGNNWGLPGAEDSTDSNLLSSSAFTVLNTTPTGSTVTFTVDSPALITAGTIANHGWALYNTGADDSQVYFYSSDHPVAEERPKLRIDYTLPNNCE